MLSNNKIKSIIEALQTSARPSKFTHEFLKKIGFSSSNDRAVIPLLRKLGFIDENSSPTEYYDDLRDSSKLGVILASRIKELYIDLYTVNTDIHNALDQDIKGAISRVTGKDEASVKRYFNTFKALVDLANFSAKPTKAKVKVDKEHDTPELTTASIPNVHIPSEAPKKADFHYNIQIHLPATTDISVYNAIFKSLKESLLSN